VEEGIQRGGEFRKKREYGRREKKKTKEAEIGRSRKRRQ